jgi:hypothetical protein
MKATYSLIRETQRDIFNLLTEERNRKIIRSVSDDVRSLKISQIDMSTLQHDEDASIIGEFEFEFDSVVLNSNAYRRAFFLIKERVKN